MTNDRIFKMPFQKVFPLLIAKAEKKGRTREEVFEVTEWLTGYTAEQIEKMLADSVPYGAFFEQAPCLNENRRKITGSGRERSMMVLSRPISTSPPSSTMGMRPLRS